MQEGQKVLLHASLETRIDRTLADYRVEDEATVVEVDQILQSLRMALGRQLVDHLRDCLRQNRLRELVAILLNDYYDPRYYNSMKNYHYAAEFSAENLDQTVDNLRKFRDKVAILETLQSGLEVSTNLIEEADLQGLSTEWTEVRQWWKRDRTTQLGGAQRKILLEGRDLTQRERPVRGLYLI